MSKQMAAAAAANGAEKPGIINFRHDSIGNIQVPVVSADATEEAPPKLAGTVEEPAAPQEEKSKKKKNKKKQGMKGKNERQKERIKSLQQEFTTLEEQNAALKRSMEELRSAQEKSGGERDQLRSKLAEMSKDMAHLKKSLSQSETKLKAENVELQEKIASELREKKELADRLERMGAESREVKEECSRLQECAAGFQSEIATMREEMRSKPQVEKIVSSSSNKKMKDLEDELKMSEIQREELKLAKERAEDQLQAEIASKRELQKKLDSAAAAPGQKQEQVAVSDRDQERTIMELRENLKVLFQLSDMECDQLKQSNAEAEARAAKEAQEKSKLAQELKIVRFESKKSAEECARLGAENKRLRSELETAAKSSSKDQKSVNEEHERKVDELLTNLKNLEINRAELKDENVQLSEKVNIEAAQKTELSVQLQFLQSDLVQAQDGFNRAKTESEALKHRLNEITAKLKCKEEELTKSSGASEQELLDAKKEILSLRQQVTMSNMDKSKTTAALATAQNKLKMVQDENSKLHKQLDDINKKHDKLRLKSRSDVESAENKLRGELEKMKKTYQHQIFDLNKTLESTKQEKGSLAVENSNLKKTLEEKSNDDSWVQVDHHENVSSAREEELTRENQEMKTTIVAMNEEMNGLKKSQSELSEEAESLRRRAEDAEATKARLAEELRGSQASVAELQRKLAELEKANLRLRGDTEQRLGTINATLRDLEQQNKSVRASAARDKGDLERRLKEASCEIDDLKLSARERLDRDSAVRSLRTQKYLMFGLIILLKARHLTTF